MKKTAFVLAVFFFMCNAFAQNEENEVYKFSHGPYLQGLTDQSVIVYFTTSKKGFSSIELREKGKQNIQKVFTLKDGLIEANNTRNEIKLSGLHSDTEYEYRLFSVKIDTFRLSRNIYGDTITTPWYTFKTLNPNAQTCTFVTTSDIHDNSEKYAKLLSYMPLENTDMVFLLGDILSHFSRKDQPYSSFIDVSVDLFARNIPFILIRGNHDTRGQYARDYDQYVYRPDNRFYGTYQLGNTLIIMLDTGEDKPDDHFDYSGLTAFEAYRQEQVEWLKDVVKSKEFHEAEHRIVMAHIPPIKRGDSVRASAHGADMVDHLFMPILNKEKIDLMISGHTHRFSFREPLTGENNFPILINDNNSISFFEVSSDGIYVKTVNTEGIVVFEKKIAKQF